MKIILAVLFLLAALCMLGAVVAGALDVVSTKSAVWSFIGAGVAAVTCYDLYNDQRNGDRR